jgi:hypothetical protein
MFITTKVWDEANCYAGEKIDSLVAKSDGLSAQSKMFYTQGMSLYSFLTIYANNLPAKKQNSCAYSVRPLSMVL